VAVLNMYKKKHLIDMGNVPILAKFTRVLYSTDVKLVLAMQPENLLSDIEEPSSRPVKIMAMNILGLFQKGTFIFWLL